MPTSRNEKEITKFSQLAQDWWKKNGKFKVLHNFNNLRVDYISNILSKNNIEKNTKILDVGCGGGILAESLTKIGYKVHGIDASLESINIAIKHAKDNKLDITYEHSTPESFLGNNQEKFSVIMVMEVIEHIDNVDFFISTLSNLLSPNGIIFFSTINRNIKSLLLAKFAAEYILRWLPQDTHDYKKFITPAEILKILEKHSLKMEGITGINFNPLRYSWYLQSTPSINYLCWAKKL